MYAERGFGLCLVERNDDATPVGMCGLIKRDGTPYRTGADMVRQLIKTGCKKVFRDIVVPLRQLADEPIVARHRVDH